MVIVAEDLIAINTIDPASRELEPGDRVWVEGDKVLGCVEVVDAKHGLARVRTRNAEAVVLPLSWLTIWPAV